jgi:hypothetical protein
VEIQLHLNMDGSCYARDLTAAILPANNLELPGLAKVGVNLNFGAM